MSSYTGPFLQNGDLERKVKKILSDELLAEFYGYVGEIKEDERAVAFVGHARVLGDNHYCSD